MLICSTRRSSESWTSMRRYGQVVVAVASTTATTYRTRRANLSLSLFNCTSEHPQVTSRSHQVRTRRSGRRCLRHLANGTETVAQQTQGRVRRRPVRATSLDVLPVLRLQGETHPRQHLGGTAVISPSAPRTTAVFIRASDR